MNAVKVAIQTNLAEAKANRMPSAATPPAILILAAVALLLIKTAPPRGWRVAGAICLLALALSGYTLTSASRQLPAPSASSAAATPQTETSPELLLDPLALTLCWAAVGLGFLLALPTLQMQAGNFWAPERYAGLLFSLAGFMLLVMARDLIVLALSIELVTLPILLIRVTQRLTRHRLESVAQSLLLSLLSTALLWFGLAMLYGMSGTTRLPECIQMVAAGRIVVEPASLVGKTIQLGIPAAALMLAGLGVKAACVLTHVGQQDAADSTPTWQTSLPATIASAGFVVAAWRLIGLSWGGELDQTIVMISLLFSAIAMLSGALMACSEIRVSRLLVCCVVAHAGNALMAVTISAAAGFFYLGSCTLAIAGIYAVLNYLSTGDREIENIDDLAGLARTQPVAAVAATVLLLALAGLPPLPLFWGNVALLFAAFTAPDGSENSVFAQFNTQFAAMAVATALSSLLLASVYIRLVSAMLLKIQIGRQRPAGGYLALAAAVAAALLTVALSVWPAPLLEHLNHVVPSANR